MATGPSRTSGSLSGFEEDQGTEKTHRVIAELGGYKAFLRATGRRDAILFRLSSPRTEKSFQQRLAEHPAVLDGRLLVATNDGQGKEPTPSGNSSVTTAGATSPASAASYPADSLCQTDRDLH